MYGQAFQCDVVVLGPAADIEAMESRLTALSRSAVGVRPEGRSPYWDSHPGWPSDEVKRRGQPARGRVVYEFVTFFYDPRGWGLSQAREWARLSFRSHCRVVGEDDDDSWVRRDWFTAAGLTRSEDLYYREADPFWGSDGWKRWLAESGFPEDESDASEPSVVWSAEIETGPAAASAHGRGASLDLLEVVREAIADGSLSEVGPLVLSSGTKLPNPEAAAQSWLEEAEHGTWIAGVARGYLEAMMAALDANRLGRRDDSHAGAPVDGPG